MVQFLWGVLGIYTITLLTVLILLYFKVYINHKKMVLYTVCSLYFVCLILFGVALVKDFLYTP